METEEITKLVDGIYKNILEKFNPGARQLINAGKTYLKALHGAAAASKLYVEAINKLAKQAQQGTWGGSADIGSALLQIVEVYKEIQNQQMNILKAFYVDLLVPLETNLEKDTKVVQSEQKRFMQQHKQRSETYSKAAATMKKQRKKNKGTTKTGLAMDKEVKNMQILEEERTKLDAFCEQSLKTAMTQERRRYGFVLERQCSLAKHYLAYHSQGSAVLQRHLDEWQEVAQTREYLPDNVDSIFTNRLRQVSFWPDEDVYSSPRSPNMEDDRLSIASQLRKTKSMDASCLDVRSINDVTSPLKPLSRAKSEFNLTASTHSLVQDQQETLTRPKSIAVERGGWDSQLARALYAYLSSGDNQLSFLEGDIIALMGDRNKGWQFGENLRTQCSGWFPLAYTEMLIDDHPVTSPSHQRGQSYDSGGSGSSERTTTTTPATPPGGGHSNFSVAAPPAGQPAGVTSPGGRQGKTVTAVIETSRTSGITMFGDTLTHRPAPKQMAGRGHVSVGPPPLVPAPVPTPKVPSLTLPVTQRRLIQPPPMPPLPTLLTNATKRAPGVIGNVGNASLHSSNDSGFSNDPPPAPEVDYSDDDSARKSKAHRPRKTKKLTADDVTKNRLLSSVRGWLLYKSALDLWDDVNSQDQHGGDSHHHQSLPRHTVVRQSSSVGHLVSLGRSEEEVTPTSQPEAAPPRRHEPLGDRKSVDATAGIKVKRSKSIWRFRKNDVDMGVVEGMALWQHRSLVDVHAASAGEEPATTKEEVNNRKNNKGTPIMKTKLVPVKYGEEGEETKKEVKEKYVKKGSPILDRKDKENNNFLNKSKDDLAYEEVPSPELSIRKLKAKLKRTTDTADEEEDDGLVTRHKMSDSSFGYDTDVSLQGDSESCIVVDDHLRAATLKNNKNHNKAVGENGTLLPRTKLMMKYSLTLGSKTKSKSRETVNIGDGEGLLYYGKTLEKRLSKPERGSRFDQMSTTTGNMCGPWYDLWGVDASVIKKQK